MTPPLKSFEKLEVAQTTISRRWQLLI